MILDFKKKLNFRKIMSRNVWAGIICTTGKTIVIVNKIKNKSAPNKRVLQLIPVKQQKPS